MSISRITTWVDGQVLTAAALNNEFDNVLNNATALISPLTGTLNANLNQISNLVLEKLSANPTTITTGRLFYDTVLGQAKIGVSLPAGTPGLGNSTGYLIVGPVQTLSRVSGLTGSIVSNIGSFAALGYQAALSGRGAPVTINTTSSFSVNTQTPGPVFNGRDQAGAFASTDVHFYAAVNSLGSTAIYGICSSNPPPTGPANVSFWTYLGSAKYDVAASAVTQSWLVRGSRISPSASLQIAAVAFSTAQVTVPLATYVPSVATQFEVMSLLRYQSSVGATSLLAGAKIGTSTGTAGLVYDTEVAVDQTVPLSGTLSHNVPLTLPVRSTGPQLYWLANPTTTSQAVGVGFNLLSYTVQNGDN